LQQDAPEQLERSLQPGVVRVSLAARPISCLFSLVFCAGALSGRKGRTTVKKLYVGNLSFKATEEQVAALFSEIGVQPDSLTLLRDRFTGQPRGFGFAEIGKDAEADKAIEALNGKDFLGRALVVNEARPQREGGGGGGGGRGGHGGGGGGGGRGGRGGGYGGGGGGGRDR
jgi:RNA recognition motif-containing protein